jgi:hypothetical protein
MMVNNTNNIKKTMYLSLTSTWSSNYISPQPEAGTTYFSVALALNHGFHCARVAKSFIFCFLFCTSLFVLFLFVIILFVLLFLIYGLWLSLWSIFLKEWFSLNINDNCLSTYSYVITVSNQTGWIKFYFFGTISAQKRCSIHVVGDSCFIYVICIHLRILMFNIISISDYVRVV